MCLYSLRYQLELTRVGWKVPGIPVAGTITGDQPLKGDYDGASGAAQLLQIRTIGRFHLNAAVLN